MGNKVRSTTLTQSSIVEAQRHRAWNRSGFACSNLSALFSLLSLSFCSRGYSSTRKIPLSSDLRVIHDCLFYLMLQSSDVSTLVHASVCLYDKSDTQNRFPIWQANQNLLAAGHAIDQSVRSEIEDAIRVKHAHTRTHRHAPKRTHTHTCTHTHNKTCLNSLSFVGWIQRPPCELEHWRWTEEFDWVERVQVKQFCSSPTSGEWIISGKRPTQWSSRQHSVSDRRDLVRDRVHSRSRVAESLACTSDGNDEHEIRESRKFGNPFIEYDYIHLRSSV